MELWKLTAAELSRGYAQNDFSPCEAVTACLARNAQVNPVLNAVVCVDEAGATRAARESADRHRRGESRGPLDGIPFTVKDNLFVRGVRATWGSRLYAAFTPAEDDIPVARLRAMGAVFIGKTNTPELAMAGYTDNRVFGVTRNPWNRELTPGGSSGGAVAATAAGIAPIALATDGGGSTRVPASLTGLFGLRPSTGRVPRLHGFPALVHDLQVVGLVARSVADLQSVFDAVACPDERDVSSLVFDQHPRSAVSARPRVRLVMTAGNEPVDPQVRTASLKAAAVLAAAGCTIEEGSAPFDNAEIRAIWTVLAGSGIARVVTKHADWEAQVTPAILAAAQSGLACSAGEYLGALDRLADLRRRVRDAWSEYDFLLSPTVTALPWRATEAGPAEIDGSPAVAGAPSTFAKWVNAAAVCAISMPVCLSREGLPIGAQLVAPFGDDRRLLAMAGQFERANDYQPAPSPLDT